MVAWFSGGERHLCLHVRANSHDGTAHHDAQGDEDRQEGHVGELPIVHRGSYP